MPLYEYRCKQCGHQFEKIQSFSAPEEKECPQCHGDVERLLSAPAIQFKGSGWYVSDYARKGGSKAPANEAAKTEGGASEKPAASSNGSESPPSSTPAPTSKPASSTSKDK